MIEDNTLIISNEDEAWESLKMAIEGTLPENIADIKFNNWPEIEIKLVGKAFDSSLTTKVMEGFISLQSNVNRAYALYLHGQAKANRLSDFQKSQVEIVIKVSPGCSDLVAKFDKVFEAMAHGIREKMESRHLMMTVISTVLIVTSGVVISTHLENRREQNQLDAQRFAGERENERMKILADALTRQRELPVISEQSTETFDDILKSLATADSVEIAGHKIERDVVNGLIKSKRSKSEHVQLNGIYRITKVDSSKTGSYMVDVLGIEKPFHSFTAELSDGIVLIGLRKQLLQTAEWERGTVYLEVNAKELKGQIIGAKIIDVKAVQPEEEEPTLE